MSLTSDTQQPKLDVPFHVTVSIAVKENVSELQNVYLPSFFGPEELGDERTYVHSPQGTLYRETMTLEAHSHGPLHISPGYMDAIDARDGKPKRFLTNDLNLVVQGPALDLWAPIRAFLMLLLYGVLTLAALFVFFTVFFRRKRERPEPVVDEEPVPEPVTPAPLPMDALASALDDLRAQRDRKSVLRVRSVLWRMTGAAEGETLEDVLRRAQAADTRRRRFLTLVERAAFIEDSRLQEAIDDLLTEHDWSVFA